MMSDYSGLPRRDEREKRAWSALAIVAFRVALAVGALCVFVLVWLLELGPIF
jgi:hypothetical protein